MRKGTTITLAILLLIILGAATLQLFFLARNTSGGDRGRPAVEEPSAPVTSTSLG